MSIRVARSRDLQASNKSTLEQQLAQFYRATPIEYYEIADQAASQYRAPLMPFHCDLVNRVQPGMSLLEVGCGSAHLCPQVEAAGGTYTGMDHGEKLLQSNRSRFPRARFLQIGTNVNERFDIVASLYTIEHIVDPLAYLETMWNLCESGGLIAVICPDFVDGDSLPPSFFYGRTPRRLREKIASFALGDALSHAIDLFWHAPRWKSRARATAPGAFWINLKPRILHGAKYSIDADAVHLARLKDIVSWLERRGAMILETSLSMKQVPASVLRFNCYALARKPTL